MKILLVLPAAQHLSVEKNGYVTKRKWLRFSLLPLTTLAALTPKEHEIDICDENVENLDYETNYDVVGVTFMTGLSFRAYQIADKFRQKGVVTVAGGYHATFCSEEALRHFDIVVKGEAENLWRNVLKDIENRSYKSIYTADMSLPLNNVPVPRRDTLKNKSKHYATVNAVQTGRGCFHKCKFCSVTEFFQHCHRTRPIDDVIEELKGLPKGMMFVDDNIIGDVEYAKTLFKRMAKMKKKWISQCSIEIADDPELLKLAKEAGCIGLFVGIETINEENLEQMEKNFNQPDSYAQRVKRIHKAGIGVQAGMIVGLDNDDVGVFERTLKFLDKAKIDALQLAILTPLPGTKLFKEFDREGRIIDYNWSKYDYRHVVIKPGKMRTEQLQAGADWLYNQFYRLDRIIWRNLRVLFTMGPLHFYVMLNINKVYRYDNIREGIVGWNPARKNKKFKGDYFLINGFEWLKRKLKFA